MLHRKLPVALAAACLAVGLSGAPAASAAAPAHASAKKPTAKTVDKKLDSTRKSLKSTRKSLGKLNTDLGALGKRLGTAEGSLGALTTAAPALVDGLTKLSGAVQNQIAPGLLALQAALKDQVQPALTQLGDAVKTTLPNAIKDNVTKLAGSNEYGIIQPFFGASAIAGAAMASPNVPDDLNVATLTGTVTIPLPAGTAASAVTLRAAVRSGESDGDGTVAAAGVNLASLSVVPGSADVVVSGGGANGAPISTSLGAAFIPVNTKTPLIDSPTPNPLGFPTDPTLSVDATGGLTAGQTKFTLANPSANDSFAQINYTVRFLDQTPSQTDLTA